MFINFPEGIDIAEYAQKAAERGHPYRVKILWGISESFHPDDCKSWGKEANIEITESGEVHCFSPGVKPYIIEGKIQGWIHRDENREESLFPATDS